MLATALGYALKEGKIIRNVATLVDVPARRRPEMQPFTRQQVRVLLDGVRDDPLEALYVAAVGTGLRQGELLALRWQDVDLERGMLTVHHTLARFTHELVPQKTERSRRTLRMPQQVVSALTAHREQQQVIPLSGLIFTTVSGKPLARANVLHSLRRTLRRLGLPPRRFHDLRHTFATLAIEAGEGIDAASRALGHTSRATTADVYAHWTPAMQDGLAQRMDAVLGGSGL